MPNWEEIGFLYRTNSMRTGPSRSNYQQEFKWAWEQMMDEMAEAVRDGPDEVPAAEYPEARDEDRHRTRRADDRSDARDRKRFPHLRLLRGRSRFWKKARRSSDGTSGIRCPAETPEGSSGVRIGDVPAPCRPRGLPAKANRTSIGCRLGLVQGGGAAGLRLRRILRAAPWSCADVWYSGELEIDAEGHVVLHYGQPDSGTNHGTSMSMQVAEILGYTNLDHIRLIWGDSDDYAGIPGLE